MDTKSLPKISIICKENWATEKRIGRKINKWLGVAWSEQDGYKIFRLDTGLPLIETKFMSQQQCLEFAVWIAEKYKDFFDIWEGWKDCELLRVAQYSIPNGVEVYKTIEKVSSQRVVLGR